MFKWSSRRSGARGTGSSGADVEVVQLSHVQVVQPLELCNCHMFKLCSSIHGVAIMVQWCSCNSNTSARVQWCSCRLCRSGAPVIWPSGAAVQVLLTCTCSSWCSTPLHLARQSHSWHLETWPIKNICSPLYEYLCNNKFLKQHNHHT